MPKTAVILFPGTNCELEMLRACRRSNINPELIRWNEDSSKLKNYDAIILPGGFSYEDRGRSGVIAARDPLMKVIREEAQKGKPILGVCNGAQILVESGLIPGLHPDHLDMALAWNERIQKGKLLGIGYYNDWIYMRSDQKPKRSPFNRFNQKVIMRVPVAHGEGRFTTRDPKVLKTLIQNGQTLFRYCDEKGKIRADFPVNTNNAIYNLAGVCNLEGNVLALMPHPERTLLGQPLFDSLADYLRGPRKVLVKSKPQLPATSYQLPAIRTLTKHPDILITVSTIITDNEERTIENTMKKTFPELKLGRKIYYGINVKSAANLKKTAETIIKSGEILNLNKELPTIAIRGKTYGYDKAKGLIELKKQSEKVPTFFATEHDNYQGQSLQKRLAKYFKKNPVARVERGVAWQVHLKKSSEVETLVRTNIFHNPNSMKIVRVS